MSDAAFLAKVDIFSELDESGLAKVAVLLEEKRIPRGEILFRRGDPGGSMYLIHEGFIHVVRRGEDGHETILARLGPGEILGEMSYFTERPRSADAVSAGKSGTTVYLAEREAIRKLFSEDIPLANGVMLGIIRKLARRLSTVDDQIEQFQDVARFF